MEEKKAAGGRDQGHPEGGIGEEIKMKYRVTIIMILMLAVASRAIGIGVYPVGIHADEAYAGYEAYSMLMDGIDSWGYHNPVYLTVWGSGMSVLASLFMMPFIRLGGLNLAMVRKPVRYANRTYDFAALFLNNPRSISVYASLSGLLSSSSLMG